MLATDFQGGMKYIDPWAMAMLNKLTHSLLSLDSVHHLIGIVYKSFKWSSCADELTSNYLLTELHHRSYSHPFNHSSILSRFVSFVCSVVLLSWMLQHISLALEWAPMNLKIESWEDFYFSLFHIFTRCFETSNVAIGGTTQIHLLLKQYWISTALQVESTCKGYIVHTKFLSKSFRSLLYSTLCTSCLNIWVRAPIDWKHKIWSLNGTQLQPFNKREVELWIQQLMRPDWHDRKVVNVRGCVFARKHHQIKSLLLAVINL